MRVTVEIGCLRHRIEIGKYVEGRNEWGDPLPGPVWQRVALIWGSVEALTGRTFFEAQQSHIQSDHRIIIRWRRGVEPRQIVRHGDREFEIQAVLDRDGDRRWLHLLCREVAPA